MAQLPGTPGVYRMLDAEQNVLYIGKAKNLRNRVTHYTQIEALPIRLQRMVHMTACVEVTITSSEAEALLLEATLVKRLQPRYNILLRDDKTFPFIQLSGEHAFPRISKYRGSKNEPGDYFGPFISPSAVDETITLLQKAFLLRPCPDTIFRNRSRPCLQHQIKRCSAPCVGRISEADYAVTVRQAKDFLQGRSRSIQDELERQMAELSAKMEYEKAGRLRDRIRALTQVQNQNSVQGFIGGAVDLFAMHREGVHASVLVACFRDGRNYGDRSFFPAQIGKLSTDSEVLTAFIGQFYQQHPPPGTIYVSHILDETALLEEALSLRAGHQVSILCPIKGSKRTLVLQAIRNTKQALQNHLAVTQEAAQMMARMQELFELPELPQRIEVYDNSHMMGTHPVGAMIVAGAEGFRKNAYRKFKLEGGNIIPGDDYAMMRMVLTRRFRRLQEPDAAQETKPELILIDGGQGQLAVALEVMADLGVSGVAVAGIAKGEDRNAGREKIFLPNKSAPIELPQGDALLHYLQRLRDEAHRFAITFHRGRRMKAIRNSGIDDIVGIGPQRRRALIQYFGSVKAITGAGVDELAKIEGISRELAQRIYDFYHN